MKKAIILAAMAVLCLTSCENIIPEDPGENLPPRKDIVLTKAQADFVKANNGFALDLFRQVAQGDKDKSLLISPLSVTIDFGMVNKGAAGTTQQEIYETLGYKESSLHHAGDRQCRRRQQDVPRPEGGFHEDGKVVL